MNLEEIAVKYSSFNGMKLIDFSEVALPIYRISAIALIQEKVDLHTIDEFSLRAIHLGFKTLQEISNLLGISEEITRISLSSLIQANLVSESSNRTVNLTAAGFNSAGNYSKIRPFEEQIVFDYDGILRQVKLSSGETYLSPKEVKDQGLIEIRSIPAKRPEVEDIKLQDVSRALSKFTAIDDSNKTLLRIRDISKAVRLFYKGVMLIYKDQTNGSYEAAFCIDGIMSHAHGLAFLNSDGLDRLGLIQKLEESSAKSLASYYPDFIVDDANHKELLVVSKLKRKKLSLKLNAKQDNPLVGAESTPLKHSIDSQKIRTLPVYEHPKILYSAIKTANSSLIIISPWITRAVVNINFAKQLEELLRRNVEVKIGFGIGDDDRYDTQAQSLLTSLSKRYNNITLKNLGDTHAKILIKDNEFYVITSFNWLSFKGDSKKKFREEWGNYVEDKNVVEKFRLEIEKRFV